jgi:hypothetical protein
MAVAASAPCVEHSTGLSVPLELNVGFRIDSTLNTVPLDLLRRNNATQLQMLIRVGGMVAVLAGVLRALASFAPAAGDGEQQVLYLVVDILLLFAVLAVYAHHHEALGGWGASGFLIVVTGILLVRSSRSIPGIDLYPAGAFAVVAGWVLLSAVWRRRARGSAVVLLLFAASAVAGLIGQLVPRAAALAVLSGILFGGTMIAPGEHVLRSLRRRRNQQSTQG